MGITWNTFLGGITYLEPFGALTQTVQQPTTTSFYLQMGNYTVAFQGQFTLSLVGTINGGTITGFKGYVGGVQAINAYGYEMDYLAFNAARQTAGTDPSPLLDLLYASGLTVNGSDLSDDLSGSPLADVLSGFAGDDFLSADKGDDFVTGGEGKDVMIGGAGVDTVSYLDKVDSVKVALNGDAEAFVKVGGVVEDTISDFENVIGGSGNDRLTGDGFNNVLIGVSGDDAIFGKNGNDRLFGFDGRDLIEGGRGSDKLDGGDGKDRLRGDAGFDELHGGAGNDVLIGGRGGDWFVFDTKLSSRTNVDDVKDFTVNHDMIGLDMHIFTKVGASLSKGEFHIGSRAGDEDDRIIYNEETGKLKYDKNGSEAGGAKTFAVLDTHLDLDHRDFFVYDGLVI